MRQTLLPAELLAGDRLPGPIGDPESTWPVVEAPGEEVDNPEFGRMRQVRIVGVKEPRGLPAETPIEVDRAAD